ncbi:MAG TPA: hypothetical protein VF550_11460 [Polyangia bacterium]
MARNYGISILLLFIFAWLYRAPRRHPVWMGVVLLCLANANIHSLILAGVLMTFWLWDELVCRRTPLASRAALGLYLATALLAAGIVAAVLTLWPSNQIVSSDTTRYTVGNLVGALGSTLYDPAKQFGGIAPRLPGLIAVLINLILVGSTLGLVRRPALIAAAWAAMLALSVLFTLVYPGSYRHQGLFIVFLITLTWMSFPPPPGEEPGSFRHETWRPLTRLAALVDLSARGTSGPPHPPPSPAALPRPRPLRFRYAGRGVFRSAGPGIPRGRVASVLEHIGLRGCLPALLLISLSTGIYKLAMDVLHNMSGSRAFASYLEAHPEHQGAILIGEPDYCIESMPYYAGNPIYIVREHRFGDTVRFTRQSNNHLDLGDLLREAKSVGAWKDREVLIAIGHLKALDSILNGGPSPNGGDGFRSVSYSYGRTFTCSPQDLKVWRASTQLVARFDDDVIGDEQYALYKLNGAPP